MPHRPIPNTLVPSALGAAALVTCALLLSGCPPRRAATRVSAKQAARQGIPTAPTPGQPKRIEPTQGVALPGPGPGPDQLRRPHAGKSAGRTAAKTTDPASRPNAKSDAIKPDEAEPAANPPTQARRGSAKKPAAPPNDGRYQPPKNTIPFSKPDATFPGLRIYTKKEKRIEVMARINLQHCKSLEFAACTPRGKTHESLLRIECDPKHLHLALLMLDLEPTPQISKQGELVELDTGEVLVLEVTWDAKFTPKNDPAPPKAAKGLATRRLEDLIWDRRRKKAMRHVGWVFTGSRRIKVPVPPDYTSTREVYASSYEGNVIATYHHPHVTLDTPLVEGGDDTVFIPYTSRLPIRGTPVVLHLRPWRKSDGKHPIRKAGKAKAGAKTKTGAAKTGAAKTGAAKTGAAKTGAAKTGK